MRGERFLHRDLFVKKLQIGPVAYYTSNRWPVAPYPGDRPPYLKFYKNNIYF